jgi:hypothetical protein
LSIFFLSFFLSFFRSLTIFIFFSLSDSLSPF